MLSGGKSDPKPSPASTDSTSTSPAGIPGSQAGEAGAKDVVLRGIYAAAAARDFQTVCASQTVTAQRGAAKDDGWNGQGDPLPGCVSFFKKNWSTIKADYLSSRQVVSTKPGADADSMLVTVDDPPPSGQGTTRTFNAMWNKDQNRWLVDTGKS